MLSCDFELSGGIVFCGWAYFAFCGPLLIFSDLSEELIVFDVFMLSTVIFDHLVKDLATVLDLVVGSDYLVLSSLECKESGVE